MRWSTTWERGKTGEACVESGGGGLTIDLMPDVTLDDPTIQCDDVGKVDFDDDGASTDDGDVRSDDDVQGGEGGDLCQCGHDQTASDTL